MQNVKFYFIDARVDENQGFYISWRKKNVGRNVGRKKQILEYRHPDTR